MFDELTELEIAELLDMQNELQNELEYTTDNMRIDEIQTELANIQEKLDILY